MLSYRRVTVDLTSAQIPVSIGVERRGGREPPNVATARLTCTSILATNGRSAREKIRLLEAIRDTGSITQAGIGLGMSHRRAWLLVDDMNNCFREPAIAARAGGSRGGGAALTAFGTRPIDLYRAIEAEAHASTAARLGDLEAACKRPPEATTAAKSHSAPRRRTIAR